MGYVKSRYYKDPYSTKRFTIENTGDGNVGIIIDYIDENNIQTGVGLSIPYDDFIEMIIKTGLERAG